MLIFISVTLRAITHPTRAHIDMTLFFGALAFVILASRIAALTAAAGERWGFSFWSLRSAS